MLVSRSVDVLSAPVAFPQGNSSHQLSNQFHVAEAFLRSWQVFSYSRNSTHFLEPEGSLRHLQEPATCPYPEPDRSSPLLQDPFWYYSPIYAWAFRVASLPQVSLLKPCTAATGNYLNGRCLGCRASDKHLCPCQEWNRELFDRPDRNLLKMPASLRTHKGS